jgi:hypothetical protein
MNWFPNPASMLVRQIGSNWFYLIISNKIIVSRQVFCLFGTRTAKRLIDHQGGEQGMSDREKATRWLHDVIPPEWDRKPLSIAHEIRTFLDSVKDQGTEIDSGTDGVCGDLWVTIQGIEYIISVKKSNAQLAKEGKLPPPTPPRSP